MYAAEFEAFEFEDEFENAFEDNSLTRPFTEQQEMELAAELLEVGSEEELEEFLGKLVKKAAKGIGNFVRSPAGKAVGGFLKGLAKKALPVAGAALGNFVVPGVGGAIGGKLGSFASSLFELEMEGMSPEDMEFEVARRFVRLAGATTASAAQNSQRGAPDVVVNRAIQNAARLHAPGLLQNRQPARTGRARSGRWVRSGNRIILLGV
ncbi:MAG: hypothetical protein QJT81_05105 [Candidatus Thiothrix putei]|uniref:Uncharacterized protein n=1 Tax=Candidatus Thiothrix putei TaxID=3080811 RepID=A0AA95HDE1_9GAMM|nr:MAG: hypothetical protein QJT81_05105 [Candidatus Thiothrix putei]